MKKDTGVIRATKPVIDYIVGQKLENGEAMDTVLRRLLGMPEEEILARRRAARGEYAWMDELKVGESRIVAFIYDPMNELAGAINAGALRMAVQRSIKRTGNDIKAIGTSKGLLITRLK